jgi:hypothetical protein
MSTNRSVGRSAVIHKKDRSRLCAFTFVDVRQCRTPRRSLFFHTQGEPYSLSRADLQFPDESQ